MLKKVAFIASIDPSLNFGGETVKNTVMYEFLKRRYDVYVVDIEKLKTRNFFARMQIILRVLKALLDPRYKNILISKSNRGAMKVLKWIRLFGIEARKNILFFVIGGNLIKLIEQETFKIDYLRIPKYIFVETMQLKKGLQLYGIKNVIYKPNFKIIPKKELKWHEPSLPLKMVYVSVVRKMKGLDLISEVMNEINSRAVKATLDIYGPIDKNYNKDFNEIILKNDNIQYKGILDPLNYEYNYTMLSENYDLFVLPSLYTKENTSYLVEGVPGAIIDSVASELPIVCSDAGGIPEIVNKDIGYVFKAGDKESLKETLLNIINNVDDLLNKRTAIKKIKFQYDVEEVLKDLDEYIE